jgi:hypothetical protein
MAPRRARCREFEYDKGSMNELAANASGLSVAATLAPSRDGALTAWLVEAAER